MSNPLQSRLRAAAAAVALLVAATAAPGDIQVLCEPGLRVYLDGELMGTSTDREDGLYLAGVTRGVRSLRVEKEGHIPQTFEVEVSRIPIEVEVGEFAPLPTPAAKESEVDEKPARAEAPAPVQKVGRLLVTSAPQNCSVEIAERREEKTTPQLAIGGLPAGEHTIRFSKQGFTPISGVVSVRPGGEVTVHGNLLEGEVETVHTGKGSLRVMSTPQRCTVQILGMQREKTRPRLNLSYLPAGEHRMRVSIPGRELETRVVIYDRTRTVVEVSFLPGDEPFVINHVPFD